MTKKVKGFVQKTRFIPPMEYPGPIKTIKMTKNRKKHSQTPFTDVMKKVQGK